MSSDQKATTTANGQPVASLETTTPAKPAERKASRRSSMAIRLELMSTLNAFFVNHEFDFLVQPMLFGFFCFLAGVSNAGYYGGVDNSDSAPFQYKFSLWFTIIFSLLVVIKLFVTATAEEESSRAMFPIIGARIAQYVLGVTLVVYYFVDIPYVTAVTGIAIAVTAFALLEVVLTWRVFSKMPEVAATVRELFSIWRNFTTQPAIVQWTRCRGLMLLSFFALILHWTIARTPSTAVTWIYSVAICGTWLLSNLWIVDRQGQMVVSWWSLAAFVLPAAAMTMMTASIVNEDILTNRRSWAAVTILGLLTPIVGYYCLWDKVSHFAKNCCCPGDSNNSTKTEVTEPV